MPFREVMEQGTVTCGMDGNERSGYLGLVS